MALDTQKLVRAVADNIYRELYPGIPAPETDTHALYLAAIALKQGYEQLTRTRGDRGKSALLVEELEGILASLVAQLDERYVQEVEVTGDTVEGIATLLQDHIDNDDIHFADAPSTGLWLRARGAWIQYIAPIIPTPTGIIEDAGRFFDKTWSSMKIGQWFDDHLAAHDPHLRSGFVTPYQYGNQYRKNDMVLDGQWTMHANKDTTDFAAPQPSGDPYLLYAGSSPTTSASAKQLIQGMSHTVNVQGVWVTGYEFYAIAGNNYDVYKFNGPPNAATGIVKLLDLTATTTGWIFIAMPPEVVTIGQTFSMAVLTTEPDPTPIIWSGNWNYTQPQNPAAPATGVIVHSRGSPNRFQVHKTDNDAGDRSVELDALAVGDVINGAGVSWAIQAVTDNTTWIEFEVAPQQLGTPVGVQNFDFETVSPTPITYVKDVGYFLPAAGDVTQGFEGIDIPLGDTVLDNNAYGINIEVQQAYISPDWNVVAYSGGAGGGSANNISGILGTGGPFAPAENGFVDRSESTLSFVDGTRTFTITPTGDSFSYYHDRTQYTREAADSIVISDIEGLHYIYYEAENLSVTNSFTEELITKYAFVAVIYWDATNNAAVLVGEERHGNVMDVETHRYNHSTFGARYASGLSLGDMDVDGNGNNASAAQFSVSDGSIWDEDIEHIITDGAPQELSTIAEIPMFYREGAAGDWRKVAATQYPIHHAPAGRIYWNENTGATWQLTEVGNNNYVLAHYYASNDIGNPIIGIVGQAEYGTVAAAREAAESELESLALGGLGTLTPEFVPIATVIWQTSLTYANAVMGRVRSTDSGDDYIDWRATRGGASGAAVDDVYVKKAGDTMTGDLDLHGAITAPLIAGEALIAGDMCYLNASGKMVKSDASTAATSSSMLALCTEALTLDDTGTFVLQGFHTTGGLTAGERMYVSTTAGGWTNVAPSGSGEVVRVVGYAISATQIYFNPDKTWLEVA